MDHLRLRHPLHPKHALNLRELSEYCGNLKCQCCEAVIHGSVYCCEECKLFLHKPCAEAPVQIQHHSSHPQHPLTLQMPLTHSTCRVCKKHNRFSRWYYICELCSDFNLHAGCAIATLPDNEEVVDGAMLQHPVHDEHPLSSFNAKLENQLCCHGCADFIFGEAYACFPCGIFVDKTCCNLPPEIHHHPFHHQHPLELTFLEFLGLVYLCKEGDCFPLPAISMVSILPQKEEDGREAESRSTIDHPVHQHPLDLFHAAKGIGYKCVACGKPISKGFYGCLDCFFLIHESCAKLPHEMQHYLHTNHPLSLVPNLEDNQTCGSCANVIESSPAYHCKTCNFALHMKCALKSLAYLKEGAAAAVQHFSHQHELTLRHLKKKREAPSCYGCAQEIEKGQAYRCSTDGCEFLIHKSCLELPSTLQRSSHLHPLTLRHEESKNRPTCSACRMECSHFVFSCAECELNLDVVCALERPTLKDSLHKHDLFYVAEWEKSSCKVCGKQCSADLFHCWQCGISVHYDCAHLLLKTIVSNFHVHPLNLEESVVLEEDYGEYYCDICTGTRDPELWVYYCQPCQLIGHVKCATSSVRLEPLKENPELPRLEEEIGRVQAEVDAVKADIEERTASLAALVEKLEALKTKHAELASQS